jgi:serine protease AprX
MRGIEWGAPRRLTALIAVVLMLLTLAPVSAMAKPKKSRATETTTIETVADGDATETLKTTSSSDTTSLETQAITLDSAVTTSSLSTSLETPGSLYDVAERVGLVDSRGRQQVGATGSGVTIAMIDTGVVDVPGLRNSNVVIGPDFSFEDANPDLRARDTNGHGTHLAGIVVGTDAGWAAGDTERRLGRQIGIAPDARLLSVKAGAANGATDVTQVIAAVNWVVAQHTSGVQDVDVLLLAYSAGGDLPFSMDPLVLAVERAWLSGITVVVAAGNEGQEAWKLTSPARAPFVIAVGASELTSEAESTSTFTNTGLMRAVDIHAPGQSIISLRNPGSYSDQYNLAGRVGDDLVRATGTSQAAAVVAGGAALLLEQRPHLTPDEVKATLKAGADSGRRMVGWEMLYLRIDQTLDAKTASEEQYYRSVTGEGSLDDLRGDAVVEIDGIGLQGEQDVFGVDHSSSQWTQDSWTGHTWSGHSWSADTWSGHSWSGHSWSDYLWSGHSWSGHSWSGHSWSDYLWSGHSWSGHSWSGHSWSGHGWSGHSWSGHGWSGLRWD